MRKKTVTQVVWRCSKFKHQDCKLLLLVVSLRRITKVLRCFRSYLKCCWLTSLHSHLIPASLVTDQWDTDSNVMREGRRTAYIVITVFHPPCDRLWGLCWVLKTKKTWKMMENALKITLHTSVEPQMNRDGIYKACVRTKWAQKLRYSLVLEPLLEVT